jgi:hypothetical protein
MESDQRLLFYSNTINQWIPDRHAKILVVGAGINDRNILFNLGFDNVVIPISTPELREMNLRLINGDF